MAFPIVFLMYAGRIFPIAVRVGTALSRFVLKNPKITGSTISIQAVSAAIQSHNATEKEKIDIVTKLEKKIRNFEKTFSKTYFVRTQILCQIFSLI